MSVHGLGRSHGIPDEPESPEPAAAPDDGGSFASDLGNMASALRRGSPLSRDYDPGVAPSRRAPPTRETQIENERFKRDAGNVASLAWTFLRAAFIKD